MPKKRQYLKSYLLIGLMLFFVIFIYIARHVSMPRTVWYILTGIGGIVILFLGIDQIRKRLVYETYGEESQTHRTYSGLAAVMNGIGVVVIGLVMISLALILLAGYGEFALKYLKEHPGVALLSGGIFLFSWSVSGIIGPEEEKLKRSFWLFITSIPKRILSIILVLVGLILIAGGIIEITSPALFDSIIVKYRHFSLMHNFLNE